MKLSQFLKQNGIKTSFFANKIGCTSQRLNGWISGRAIPPLNFIYLIEKFTKGEVTYKDFIVEESDLKLK